MRENIKDIKWDLWGLYPLDGTDYEYRKGTDKWEPLGSWHEQFENEFNK